MLAARGGELEREFPFGVVRQLFEAELGDAERARRAARRRRGARGARCSSDARRAEDAAGDASFAALHGLYWLTLNLAGRAAAPARDRRPALVRPAVAALPRLPRAPARGRCRCSSPRRCARPSPAPTRRCSARSPTTRRRAACARARSAPTAVAALVARAARRGRRRGLLRRLPRAPPAATRCCCASSLTRARGRGRAARRRAASASCATIGPRAVSRTVLLRLARLPAEARRGRARGRGARRRRRAAGRRRAGRARRGGRGRAPPATLVRAEILRPEPPLGFVHPLVRDAVYRELPPGERELQHARARPSCCATPARRPSRSPRSCCALPRRGEAWVVRASCARRPRGAARRARPESAVAYLRARARGAAAAEQRAHAAARARPRRGAHRRPGRGRAPARGLRRARRPAPARARRPRARAGRCMFTGRPDDGAAFARRAAAASCPTRLATSARRSRRSSWHRAYFGARVDGRSERVVALRDGRPATAPGARMLAGRRPRSGDDGSGGPADACAELALAALAGGALSRPTNGLFCDGRRSSPWPSPTARTRRRSRAEALAHAHRSGSLFSHLVDATSGRGFTLLRRGDLAEAEELAQADAGSRRRWGYGRRRRPPTRAASSPASLLERGDLAERRRRRSTRRTATDGDRSTAPASWRRAARRAAARRGPRRGGARRAPSDYERHAPPASEPGVGALALAEGPGARPARPPRRGDRARARGARARARSGARRRRSAALRVLGALEREDGLAQLEEAVAVLEARRRGSSTPRRSPRSAPRCAARGGRPTRASRCGARSSSRDRCGATALAEHVRSELYATGARPRTTALERRRSR